jgi:hypothetical protein
MVAIDKYVMHHPLAEEGISCRNVSFVTGVVTFCTRALILNLQTKSSTNTMGNAPNAARNFLCCP